MPQTTRDRSREPEIVPLVEPVRRYVAARVGDRHQVDDVVQETITRVLTSSERLEPDSRLAYALVVARNQIATGGREEARARRHAPRLVDMTTPDRPEDVALAREERMALGEALALLPEEQREELVAHEVHDEPVATIAATTGSTPGAVAARLARTRARVRLDYLLALRGIELPTIRCRPVLLALSAGDQRRQQALGAGRHLLRCATCADLSTPLLRRERALAGWLPWLSVAGVAAWVRQLLQRREVQVAAVSAGVVAVALTAGLVMGGRDGTKPAGGATGTVPGTRAASTAPAVSATTPTTPAESSAPTPAASGPGLDRPALVVLSTGAAVMAPGTPTRLSDLVGQKVAGRRVPVIAVEADEGFWVSAGGRERVWVQLTTPGESPVNIRAGQRASFTGTVVAHSAAFADRVGVTAGEGAALLAGQGAHIAVSDTRVSVDS